MGVNQVYFGNEKIMDITDSTVEPEDVLLGEAFYAADGERKTGLAARITIDDELSGTSENPVQNKVIKEEIDRLDTKIDNKTIDVDDALDTTSENPVQNKVIAERLAEEKNARLDIFPSATVSGDIASFADGADGVPVKSLIVDIKPVQNGTGDPSPDNVRPISGWDSVGVFSAGNGINLFNQETLLQAPDWVLRDETFMGKPVYGGTIRHLVDAFSTRLPVDFKFKENTRYSVMLWWRRNTPSTENGLRIRWHYTDGTYVNAALGANNTDEMVNVRVTSAAGKTLDHISLLYNSSSYIFISGFTICKYQDDTMGPVYDSMMPYHVALGQTVYGGSLVLNQDGTADLTVTKAKQTFNGTETWGRYTSENPNGTCFRTAVNGYVGWSAGAKNSIISDTFVRSALNNPSQDTGVANSFWVNAAGDGLRFIWGEPNVGSTVDEFKAFLSTTPISVVYDLATPIELALTPTEVKTLLGLNNIWADAGDVDVTYRADVQLYINKKTAQTLTAAASMLSNVETSMTATRAYAVNDFLSVNGQLYRVTAAIANGATITPGTNVVESTIGEQITALLNA